MTLLSSCTSIEAPVLVCAVAARLITVLFRLLMSYKIWEREVGCFYSRYVVCDMVCAYCYRIQGRERSFTAQRYRVHQTECPRSSFIPPSPPFQNRQVESKPHKTDNK
jgi:hypothetical protein